MCALLAQSAVTLEPDMQHITLASHTSLALALAPGGRAATKHQWTRHQVVCIVSKEVVQINFIKIMYLILDSCKTPNRFSQYFIFEYCA